MDPDNLGEIKIQTSAPNPHISVLLQNFCAKKMAAFTAHSQEYQSRQKNLMGKKKFNPMLTRSSTPMGNRLTHLRKGKFGNCSKTILMMIMFIKNIKPIKEYLPSQDHLMSIHLMNILKGQGHINKVINLPHISESSTLPFISPILQKLKTSSILQTLCTLFSMNIYNFCIMRYSATAQIKITLVAFVWLFSTVCFSNVG